MSKEVASTSEGLQRVDITTAGHLFTPEDTFVLVHEVNKSLPEALQMEIELYTTINRTPFAQLTNVPRRLGVHVPLPQGITYKDVQRWQGEYPKARVNRVHLPFDYNTEELFAGLKKSPVQQPLWMIWFGGAKNMKGVELAQQLEVGINAHTNVLTGFALDNRLDEIKKSVPFVLAEAESIHTTPLLQNPDMFSVPSIIANEIVKRYELTGLLLGVDHGLPDGIDYEAELDNPLVQQYTRAMHFAGPNHRAVIGAGDKTFTRFLRKVAKTPFANDDVTGALDYNPFVLRNMSGSQQVLLVKDTIKWIMRTQQRY